MNYFSPGPLVYWTRGGFGRRRFQHDGRVPMLGLRGRAHVPNSHNQRDSFRRGYVKNSASLADWPICVVFRILRWGIHLVWELRPIAFHHGSIGSLCWDECKKKKNGPAEKMLTNHDFFSNILGHLCAPQHSGQGWLIIRDSFNQTRWFFKE